MLERCNRAAAIVILALAALVTAWSLSLGEPAPLPQIRADYSDFRLYSQIARKVEQGAGYYDAAIALQRAHAYPVRPFVTVRLPTLAAAQAFLGKSVLHYAAIGLLVALVLAWIIALKGRANTLEKAGSAFAILAGGAMMLSTGFVVMHDMWAGALLGLALACYATRAWPLALVCAALAIGVRELAVPFVLLAIAFSIADKRWRELAAWSILLVAFLVGMTLHANAVHAHLQPGDLGSPGWQGLIGPRLVIDGLNRLTLIKVLPLPLASLLFAIPLLGWLAVPGRQGLFATLFLAGMALMIALFGRANNFYWAQLLLPVWFVGLAFIPRSLSILVPKALGRGV